MSSFMPLLSRRWNAPISRFSVTVMRGKSFRPSGDCAMPIRTMSCAGSFVMFLPSNSIVPRRG